MNDDDEERLSTPDLTAILKWLWRPYRSRTEAVLEESARTHQLGPLYATALPWTKDLPPADVDAWIESMVRRVEAYGHVGTIDAHGGPSRLLGAIRSWLPGFEPRRPDWLGLEVILLQKCKVDPLRLPAMTLVDIRRVLEHVTEAHRQAADSPTPTKRAKRPAPRRALTEFEHTCVGLHHAGHNFSEIARRLKSSRQAVSKAHANAIAKMRAGEPRGGHRSVSAFTNVEDLAARARSGGRADRDQNGE